MVNETCTCLLALIWSCVFKGSTAICRLHTVFNSARFPTCCFKKAEEEEEGVGMAVLLLFP